MEKYFEGEEPSVEEMKKIIRKATIANEMVPICCGTSYRNKGVQPLLDFVCANTLARNIINQNRK